MMNTYEPRPKTMAATLPSVVVQKVSNNSALAADSSREGKYAYHPSVTGTHSKLLLSQSRYFSGPKHRGAVFTSTNTRIRPLGLLPNRKAEATWKELSMLYDTNKIRLSVQQQPVEPFLKSKPTKVEEKNSTSKEVISATVIPKLKLNEDKGNPYRHKREKQIDDAEYYGTLAQVDIQTYDNQDVQREQTMIPPLPIEYYEPRQAQISYQERKSARMQRSYISTSDIEYLTFSGKAYLNKRLHMLDCRDPLDKEPCERCRIRGTRCSRCIAIRTGGGYIILDSGASQGQVLNFNHHQYNAGWNNGDSSRLWSAERKHRLSNIGNGDQSLHQLNGQKQNLNESGAVDRYGRHVHNGNGWEGDGWDDAMRGGLQLGQVGDIAQQDMGLTGNCGQTGGSGLDDLGSSTFTGSGMLKSRDDYDSAGSMRHRISADDNNKDGSANNQAGQQSSLSDGQPGSKEGTHDQSGDHDRKLHGFRDSNKSKNAQLDKQHKKRRKKDGVDSDSDDDYDAKKKKSKNAKQPHDKDDADNSDNGRKFKYGRPERNESDEKKRPRTGSLMKFKSKRNDLKVNQCTLKELHNIIDPLDYLAKYCIIDQAKVPHYQRVFENVDRDEDDEINIAELDFALKAVNFNLISDSELTYVNSILELAGRYALNFQLFSLVAALSEKVVALDDMVKRLINTMDFEALETKMKKCKELFYLLASDETGVVTTAALAVELQAGGLTQEHVEFVVDRLNNDGKGIVEFLDYLTYVPLFVEIHTNINDNPLDFTRLR